MLTPEHTAAIEHRRSHLTHALADLGAELARAGQRLATHPTDDKARNLIHDKVAAIRRVEERLLELSYLQSLLGGDSR